MSYAGAILVSGALYALAGPLYRLFTTDENVVRIGVDMMHFLLPSYFMYVVIGILSVHFEGQAGSLCRCCSPAEESV